MDTYICVICNMTISEEVIAARHYTPERLPSADKMTCSRECNDALRKRNGLFKEMSAKGYAGRVAFVTTHKPRKGKPRKK